MSGARVVAVVAYDQAELLEIASVLTTLAMANHLLSSRSYESLVATPGGRPVELGSGLTFSGQQALERLTGPLDTLIVSGGPGYGGAAADPRLVGHVRRLAKESRRVASVCTGAYVLAAAGLLDGRRATTHWACADHFAASFPRVIVDPRPLYVRNGTVYTSAGVTSALDLMLAFVQEDHGTELARSVSQYLVTYLHRPGDQAQISLFTAAAPADDDLVRRVVDHISTHLDGDLTTAALAASAGVSERHLTRLFTEHLGDAPGRYVRHIRTDAAANLLTVTRLPLTVLARRCGFGSTETLRRAFVDRYGVTPSHYRRTLSDRDAIPTDSDGGPG